MYKHKCRRDSSALCMNSDARAMLARLGTRDASKGGNERGGSRNVKNGEESKASRNSKSRDRCEQFKPLQDAREGGGGRGR